MDLPAATARAVLAGLDALGLDAEAIRAAAGIAPEALEPFDGQLSGEVFPRIWEEAFRRAPREELPTEVGLAIPFGAFGTLDYLAGSSPTVEAGFHSLQGHFRQVASLSLEVTRGPAGADVRVIAPRRFPGQEIADEMTIAIFVGRFRGDAGGFRASEVRLTRRPPARPGRHAELLGAPVTFRCSVPGLSIPLPAWTAPLRRADSALQATLRQIASRMELGAQGDGVEAALRARLRSLLPEGRVDAATLARTMGMSERTLHRRLREEGRTYRGVLDAFREAEAERLLSGGRGSLSEVAFRLGFADQSAWNRAFRRWKGMSPTEWLQARPGPGGASPRR
jgi:AraC-like DNA-binding protein